MCVVLDFVYNFSINSLPYHHTRTMATSQQNITNTSPQNNNTIKFSAADFQRWNQTTSVVNIPSRIVKTSKIPQLRKELIDAIGVRKVTAVQALSPTRYRIEYRYSSDRHAADINGIAFRGIQLTPLPAYEEVKSVFVDRAPLQMQDQYIFDTLAPYGRVISIQHLTVRGFPSVKSGTRRVSMVITKPIPANINIGSFSVSFRYRGQPPTCFVCQEVGHTGRGCPRSRRARKSAENSKNDVNNNNTSRDDNNTSKPSTTANLKVRSDGQTRVVTTTKPSLQKSEEDLRMKLNAKRAAKAAPKDQVAITAPINLPLQQEIEADESQSPHVQRMCESNAVAPQAEATSSLAPVALMEIETFPSPPNRRSRSAKGERYTRWDGKQAVITSPTVAAPSSPESNGPTTSYISTSPPAAHLAELRQIFNLPPNSAESELGDVPSSSAEDQFEVLARRSQSAAGQEATCTTSFVRSQSITRAFYRERLLCTYTVPVTSSFSFDARMAFTAPAATPIKSAKHRSFGAKALLCDTDADLDNISLAERRRRKRRRLTEPVPSDDVDSCLTGSSVVDPLLDLERLPPLPSSPTLATSEVALRDPSVPSSEEVTVEVLAEGYAPWASAQPHSSPLPNTNNQKDFSATSNNIYSMTVESESPPGSSSPSTNRIHNNIPAESEIPPVSSLDIVPYHDKDSHGKNNNVNLGSDTPPVSSSSNYGASHLAPISPAPPSVEAGAVTDSDESSNSSESLRDTLALQLMCPTLPVFNFLENEF